MEEKYVGLDNYKGIEMPIRCPYCGSIENNGNTCKWCYNIINFTEVKNYGNYNDTDSYA